MSDRHVAETSIWQHTTLTTDRHQCLRRDSNPQVTGRRATGFGSCSRRQREGSMMAARHHIQEYSNYAEGQKKGASSHAAVWGA